LAAFCCAIAEINFAGLAIAAGDGKAEQTIAAGAELFPCGSYRHATSRFHFKPRLDLLFIWLGRLTASG